jgi:predicted HTH transcriptional regulator
LQPCTAEQVYKYLGIAHKKGTRSAFCSALNLEIRKGHVNKVEKMLTLGDTPVKNRYSYTNSPSETDLKIIAYLKEHGASSAVEIGDAIGITTGTVNKHLRRLGASHTIQGNTYYYTVD